VLKKTIKYTDFNDVEQTAECYFHLSKSELIRLELSYPGGFENYLKTLISADDGAAIVRMFVDIILDSYGERSPNGQNFDKSPAARAQFESSAAFDALVMELAEDPGAASEFLNGVMPKDLAEKVKKNEQNAELPEPSPQADVPAWVREDRDPTRKELESMSREQMAEAFRAKSSR